MSRAVLLALACVVAVALALVPPPALAQSPSRAVGAARVPPTPQDFERLYPLDLTPTAVEPSAPPFRWDVPGVVEEAEVRGELESLGVPVRAHAVRSREKTEHLYVHFIREFRKAGLYIPPPPYQFHIAGGISLTAIDDERMISYTVIFQPNLDRSTTLILGEAHLAARRPEALAAEALPVPASARGVVRSRSEGARQVLFGLRGSPEEVVGYYRDVLGAHGFQEVEPAVFSDGRRRVVVLAERTGPGETTAAVLDQDDLQ